MMKVYIFFLISIFYLGSLNIAAQRSNIAEIEIQTSAQCIDCKFRIEEALAFERGVRKSDLDIKTKVVTVTYNENRTDQDKIRKAISKTGYDADEVKADKQAYAKLPACCKKPDDPDYVPHGQ